MRLGCVCVCVYDYAVLELSGFRGVRKKARCGFEERGWDGVLVQRPHIVSISIPGAGKGLCFSLLF